MPPESPSNATAPVKPGTTRKILVVDDDIGINLIVKNVLEKNGFEAVIADSAPESLTLMATMTPDLILLDMTMPEMDGSELFSRIRQQPHTKETPVIIMTGLVSPDEEAELNRSSQERKVYMGKPFSAAKLISSINAMLGPGG